MGRAVCTCAPTSGEARAATAADRHGVPARRSTQQPPPASSAALADVGAVTTASPPNAWRWRAAVAPLLPLAVFGFVVFALHAELARHGLASILAALRAIPAPGLLAAAGASAASYGLLGLIDWLAVRYAVRTGGDATQGAGAGRSARGAPLPRASVADASRSPGADSATGVLARLTYPRIALTSFVAYAFGHNLGLAALTGGAIRYRVYALQGASMAQVATIAGFCSLTTALGLGLATAVSLLGAPGAATAGLGLHIGAPLAQGAGALLLLAAGAFVAWAVSSGRPIVIAGQRLVPPGPDIVSAQVVVALAEFCAAATALWVLLPAGSLPFVPFVGVFAVSVFAGLASQVPGGLGVFEMAMLYALPHVPVPALLGALLAFRAIYYLAPLLLGAFGLVLHELYLQWLARTGRVSGSAQALVVPPAGAAAQDDVLPPAPKARPQHRGVRRLGRAAGRWISPLLEPIVPQMLGTLVFVAGGVLLVSGATPAIDARLQLLRHVLPLPLLELSHLLGSVVGVGLLILARALFRRVNTAFELARVLLVLGVVASLAKGIDIEEAALLLVVLAALQLSRRAFHRPSSILQQRLSGAWIACILAMVLLSVWVGLLAYSHVPYQHDLWWTFAVDANAPRMLRASFLVVSASVIILLANTLRLAPSSTAGGTAQDGAVVQVALRLATEAGANAVLMGDKRILPHPAGDAFVMYGVSGRSWIALGDPVGNPLRRRELAWQFRELADRHLCRPVFYQVGVQDLPVYLDLGLALHKLGEEARVDLATFDLQGRARAALRQSHRRAERDGASFAVLAPGEVAPLLPELRALSDAWLAAKAGAEKRFSLGRFDADYLQHFPLAVVRAQGRIVAFANLWTTVSHEELSVDLMRFAAQAPRGTMDYLFIELMLWGKANGHRWFNLGMAPLAGVDARALAPAWNRLAHFVFTHGEAFYNFDGLHRYKEKFAPVWTPRYLASPGGLATPKVLFDITTLISGGVKELVRK